LSLAVPIAPAAAGVLLDDATHQRLSASLNLMEKSAASFLDLTKSTGRWLRKKDVPQPAVDAMELQERTVSLRAVHALLKERDPAFGGLVRVQNRRYQYMWVHRRYVAEYYPDPPVF
jgi:hypothetical protein